MAGEPAPQQTATQLEANIRPELRTGLLHTVWQAATPPRDPETRQ